VDVADLPDQTNKSSTELTRAQEVITDLLAEGRKPGEIARALAKGDPKEAKKWRRRIRNWAYGNEAFQAALAAKAQGEMRLAVPVVTQALVGRGKRGRVDAIKLLYEASGFHNPRVQHDHSGDIRVVLDIPRPALPSGPGKDQEGQPDEVVDAEVVEE
jgi:hypothetical protein